jgi:hypothetical protein
MERLKSGHGRSILHGSPGRKVQDHYAVDVR